MAAETALAQFSYVLFQMSLCVLVLPPAEAEEAPPYPLLYLYVHFGSLPEKSTQHSSAAKGSATFIGQQLCY